MKISHGYFQKLFEKSKFLISDFYFSIQEDIWRVIHWYACRNIFEIIWEK